MSLQIYVAHTIASAGVRTLLLHYRIFDPATQILAQVAAGIYGPIALYEICRRVGCEWIFTLRRR